MKWQTIEDIKHAYEGGVYTPSDLVSHYLKQIDERNGSLNAFLSVWSEDAKKKAHESDERIEKKNARRLEGIPIAVKDNMTIEGKITTAGSKILENYTAVYSATVVKKLEEAGAIILGKTNLDEFAMGASTEHSAFGSTKNPHDETRVPGGSSGGSAAAVAADMCAVSIGSDTGGSIRQPASFCGVVGFKPTYGRVSRFGLIAMTSSLDQIGPFSKSVQDAHIVYDVISGQDMRDATSVKKDDPRNLTKGLQGKKFCIPSSFEKYDFDTVVSKQFNEILEKIKAEGATIDRVDIPHIDASLPVYYLLVSSEVSSNLARYDGIRYGYSADADELLEKYINSRTEGFGEEVKRRIMLGTFTLSEGYRDKYYRHANKVKSIISQEMQKTLQEYDAIISPTAPTTPFKLGENISDPLTMYLSDLFTVPANIANVPAISLPTGATPLPIGIQLMGKQYHDHELLILAESVELVIGRGNAA